MQIRKKIASIMTATAVTTMMVAPVSLPVYAAAPTTDSFTVCDVEVSGAPSSSSREQDVTVHQKTNKAVAKVSKCYNTNGSGVAGVTHFAGKSFQKMTEQAVRGLGSVTLTAFDEKSVDVDVTYHVYAESKVKSNTYWSFGTVTAK